MSAENDTNLPLSPGAKKFWDTILGHPACDPTGPGINLLSVLAAEAYGPMTADLAIPPFDEAAHRKERRGAFDRDGAGAPLPSADLMLAATKRATAAGKKAVSERDLVAVILERSGKKVCAPGQLLSTVTPACEGNAGRGSAEPQKGMGFPAKGHATPTLDHFGRDLTKFAADGRLGRVIGREEEIRAIIETLCRQKKRNPALVGPAGTGKTAIVEGLAQRIVDGAVPEPLRGVRLIELQPGSMTAGAGVVGEMERRMQAALEEASHEGVILFIDEMHSMVGAGGRQGSGDMASLLKPVLARGDIACIAATTDEEYRQFIEQDSALERRFQRVPIEELSVEQTATVIEALAANLKEVRDVDVPAPVQRHLIQLSARYLRHRTFPDKAVDLLEQCVAHAVAEGQKSVAIPDAEEIVQRMVGMPIGHKTRHAELRERLLQRLLLPEAQVEALVARLRATSRDLDVDPLRPNAVVLLSGPAAGNADPIAALIAGVLFGAENRVVRIDFGAFHDAASVTSLVGAPPGYIGHGDRLPIHRIAQTPWCVIVCTNLHVSHPQPREVLCRAMADGYFTDSRGKKVYLSEAVVILTAKIGSATSRHMGFGAEAMAGEQSTEDDIRNLATKVLGAELVSLCDVFCAEKVEPGSASRTWMDGEVMGELATRYSKCGLDLTWEPAVVDWLIEQEKQFPDWRRRLDNQLGPLLVPRLPEDGKQVNVRLVARQDGGLDAVDPRKGEVK